MFGSSFTALAFILVSDLSFFKEWNHWMIRKYLRITLTNNTHEHECWAAQWLFQFIWLISVYQNSNVCVTMRLWVCMKLTRVHWNKCNMQYESFLYKDTQCRNSYKLQEQRLVLQNNIKQNNFCQSDKKISTVIRDCMLLINMTGNQLGHDTIFFLPF